MAINQTDLDYLINQEELLDEVVALIDEAPRKSWADLKAIEENIKKIREEIKGASERDLPSLFYQLNLHITLGEKFANTTDLPDRMAPYFGHMTLEIDGKSRDILLGHVSFINSEKKVRIVDWKKTPIASVYYNYDEGEEFELDLPDREIEGTLLSKSILTIINGKLLRVDRSGNSYVRNESEWISLDVDDEVLQGGEGQATRTIGFGTGKTGFVAPDIASLLDKEQFKIINKEDPLLLIGGAGSGKTTVALHRIATLCKQKRIPPDSVMVAVPHRGLVRLSKTLLKQIGLGRVRVKTTHGWIHGQASRLIADLPNRTSEYKPLGVSIIKRHGSLFNIMQDFVAKKELELKRRLGEISDTIDLVERFESYGNIPMLKKLEKIEALQSLSALQRFTLKDERTKIFDLNSDRLEIFSDRNLLEKLPTLSDGVITQKMIDDTLMHTAAQMRVEYDEDQQGIDGEGIGSSLSGTIDEEEFAIVLKLLHMKTGNLQTPKGKLRKFNHLVLDEAQELSPVELKLFGDLVEKNGSITVAGDSAQQIDQTISFHGWGGIMEHLGVPEADLHELNISYRSPASIVEFAHKALGPYGPKIVPESKRKGSPVKFTQVQHRAHSSMVLHDSLLDLMNREPKASIAVICNQMETAKAFHQELKDLGKVRLIEDAEFNFRPGVDITTIEQIRGLEFDYVIIPDADSTNYPDNPRARRRLHLAATRAIHQLWVLSPSNKSPIVHL